VHHTYGKVTDPPRINYWDCGENPNNAVFQDKSGTTQFKDLGFKDKEKGKP
jgi:hypothetical protein